MKKIITLLLIAIFSLSLVACDEKDENSEGNNTTHDILLDNADNTYYVSSNIDEWQILESNKMTKHDPNSVSDVKVNNLIADIKSNVSEVYTGSVILDSQSENTVNYNGRKVNQNLLFEIIIKINTEKETIEYRIPSNEKWARYQNLTPNSLLNINNDDVYSGAAANATANDFQINYIVVVVRYKEAVNGSLFGLGLIFNKSIKNPVDDNGNQGEGNNHEHIPCPDCGKCTASDCDGLKCQGHTPSHEHIPCPECGKCTASDCDGLKCQGHTTIPTPTPNPEDERFDSNDGADILPSSYNLASNVQDGLILHSWNWSYNNIRLNLEQIATAGYTTVQVSPVQQPRDYKVEYGKGWAQQWWKFYQPVSFSISNNSWLGTKAELTQLCTAAKSYGVKIIVDIVANHTANVDDITSSGRSTPALELKDYEAELYNNRAQYFRSEIKNNDSNIQAVVHGNIGMPDLKTETKYVQNMVLDLLKECIDCGVDGFRFDAAKHIETPDDGQYASDFWPTVINGAEEYAKSKNTILYYYGEILNTPGNGRSWTSYTKYMSITDNSTGNNIRNAIVNKNVSGATATSYLTGQPANKLVLWAESHDTYANTEQESTHVSQADINKTWALVASRKDATALFFARPGEVGSIGTWDWMSVEVSAVNKFHNQFIGANENVYSSGNYSIVERYNTTDCGAVIVNINGNESNVSFKANNLSDGTYIDTITGNTFTVSNGTVSGKMGKTGIVVLSSVSIEQAPIISVSQAGGFYSQKLDLTVELAFATEARVIIGSDVHYITETTTFTIDNVSNTGKIKVEICAINEKYRVTEKYEFIRLDGVDQNTIVITGVPSKYYTDYDLYAWVWKSGNMIGNYVKATISGDYVLIKTTIPFDEFLLAANKKGYSFDWTLNVKYQTNDFLVKENTIYVANESVWKQHTE